MQYEFMEIHKEHFRKPKKEITPGFCRTVFSQYLYTKLTNQELPIFSKYVPPGISNQLNPRVL